MGVVCDMRRAGTGFGNGRLFRFTAALLAAAMLTAGCGGAGGGKGGARTNGPEAGGGDGSAADGRPVVVTSIYPLYFLASGIGGALADVANLVPAGVEPHDWTPKSRDLARIAGADLFLVTGTGFEGWTDELLEGIGADAGVLIAEAGAGIELIPLEPDAGAHGRDHEQGGHRNGHGHEGAVDPHIWVSPKSMLKMAENVRDALIRVDPEHADAYEANHRALAGRLEALDQAYERGLSGLSRRDIVVSHRAFAYLCRDYGLNQIAVMGLNPEEEPKAQDLKRIVAFVRENGIRYIFFEELVSDRLARTLAEEAGAETLVLNPVEGLTPEQEAAGEDFVTIMEKNLQNLIKALQ